MQLARGQAIPRFIIAMLRSQDTDGLLTVFLYHKNYDMQTQDHSLGTWSMLPATIAVLLLLKFCLEKAAIQGGEGSPQLLHEDWSRPSKETDFSSHAIGLRARTRTGIPLRQRRGNVQGQEAHGASCLVLNSILDRVYCRPTTG